MMKKVIFTIAFLCSIISVSLAQEKGDQFLGFNLGVSNQNDSYNSQNQTSETKSFGFGVQFSSFVQNNRSFNFGLVYQNSKIENTNSSPSSKINSFGVGVSYGIFYPLFKSFYAEVTPGINYLHSKQDYLDGTYFTGYTGNAYTFQMTGGIMWIPFKHFGMILNIASLSFGYQRSESVNGGVVYNKQTSSSFNFTNQGGLNSQSFTIFYKFK